MVQQKGSSSRGKYSHGWRIAGRDPKMVTQVAILRAASSFRLRTLGEGEGFEDGILPRPARQND